MRSPRALVLALILAATAATLPAWAADTRAPSRPSLEALSDVRGVVYSNVFRPMAGLVPDLPRLRAAGVNHVTLYVYLFVDTPTSSSVERGPTTPTDAELGAVIDLAHASGMTVAVAPLPWWAGGQQWRGTFKPEQPDAFFDSWRFYVNHFAALSEAHDVELFSIGSEQNSLLSQTAQWRRTAAEARRRYSGPLTYLAPLNTSFADVKFWDALDVVSVSPYISVSQRARPTYGEVHATWSGYVMSYLRRISRETGRKVLIAETGFVNAEYFGKLPFVANPSKTPAPQAQADAYAAVIDAISGTRDRSSFLLGIAWWDWDPLSLGPTSATFSPRGKPAECVLAQKWATASVLAPVVSLTPCSRT